MTLPRPRHLLALLPAVAGCREAAPSPSAPPAPSAVAVVAAPVTQASWDRTVSIIGTLFPKDETTVAAEIAGPVEKTLVEFGDRVTQGQLLAAIDQATYAAEWQREQGNLARIDANLRNARQILERNRGLQKSGAVAASELDSAIALVAQWEGEASAAQGGSAMAKLNLERTQIKAPFDGAIAQRSVTRGDYVRPGTPLFTIVNDKVLKFIFEVPERHASEVRKGLTITFGVDNYPGETFTGSVYLISPVVTMATRAFNVGALVQNSDLRLKASTFARGRLILGKGVPTCVVPQDAVITFAGVTRVFVVENGRARSRVVKAGRVQERLQEILEGLKPGESIVVSGHNRLIEGAAVAPSPAPPRS